MPPRLRSGWHLCSRPWRKRSRTPEQARMPLLYAPYVPSLWEDFILRNRRILSDQMAFLMAHVPKSSRLMA